MRWTLIFLFALIVTACPIGSTTPCSQRPTDPMCIDDTGGIDVGTGDAGSPGNDAGPIDAYIYPCGQRCAAPTPLCDMGSHTCVACLASTDCTTAAMARCDTTAHACAACTGNGDCMHLTATPACNTTSGTCVQCVTNADCAGMPMHGCDTMMHACVAFTAASASACDRCVADAQCQMGQLCVPMTSGSTALGSFCAWRHDATGSGAPNGDCANVAPYLSTMSATSSDGTMTMLCEPAVSTCPALHDFRTGGRSTTGMCSGTTTGVMDDPDCGAANVADGYCRIDTGGHHLCTVQCSTMADCPCTGGACTAHFACTGGFCALP